MSRKPKPVVRFRGVCPQGRPIYEHPEPAGAPVGVSISEAVSAFWSAHNSCPPGSAHAQIKAGVTAVLALAQKTEPDYLCAGCMAEAYGLQPPQQPAPSAPVGVEGLVSLLRAGNWREVYVGHRCMRLEVTYEHAVWERLMEQVDDALAQQPAAVDEAMVERALQAWFETDDWVALLSGIEPAASSRSRMRAALTAALAAQQGGSDNDR